MRLMFFNSQPSSDCIHSCDEPEIFQEIAAAGTEALVEAGETTTLDLVLTLERNRLAN